MDVSVVNIIPFSKNIILKVASEQGSLSDSDANYFVDRNSFHRNLIFYCSFVLNCILSSAVF